MLSSLLRKPARSALQKRFYNFASPAYVSCFGNVPTPSKPALQAATLDYLAKFDEREWYDLPIKSLLNGKELDGGVMSDTVDAFNKINGKIIHSTPTETDSIIAHINTYTPSKTDYRAEVRLIEHDLLTIYPGLLIGNQALDFRKQDGVTEIEESIQANVVEQRMNDLLFLDEVSGKVNINRSSAFVGCVSNFTNFLDLFRKTLRNMELGVPCVVLSRSNTTQHMYRWNVLLLSLMKKHGIDAGMLTYASCELSEVKRIFNETPETCPMYITCSRELAQDVKSTHKNTVASTGGPNTLVAPVLTQEVQEAIRFSAMIENSGQCTALRHTVVAGATKEAVEGIFKNSPVVSTAADSLRAGEFAGLFSDSLKYDVSPVGYSKANGLNAHFKIDTKLPADKMEEHWRKVFVDVTSQEAPMEAYTDEAKDLAAWLVRNQPISLAVNDNYQLALYLFERTGQCVYTVGSGDALALTCQARPQEGEIFGEFPPRKTLNEYTKYPVIVPSPTPAYNSTMSETYLTQVGQSEALIDTVCVSAAVNSLVQSLTSTSIRGYCIEVAKYLNESCGPKTGYGERTTLWGLQRPPLDDRVTLLRCEKETTLDEVCAKIMPFLVTNARSQFEISVDDDNVGLMKQMKDLGMLDLLSCKTESFLEWEARKDSRVFSNVITADDGVGSVTFPLVGQFTALYLGVGHVKSTKKADAAFLELFSKSEKWLAMRHD